MSEVTDRILVSGDIDRRIHFNTGLDLNTDGYVATDLTFKVQRPDATTFNMTNVRQIDDAATGQVSVLTTTGNLNQTGEFIVQITASHAGKPTVRSTIMSFMVEDAL